MQTLFWNCSLTSLLFFYSATYAPSQTMEDLEKAVRKGTRLSAVETVRKASATDPKLANILPQLLPLVSDYSVRFPFETIQSSAVQHQDYLEQATQDIVNARFFPAVEQIAKLSQDRRVVILNEAHDMAQHRAFGLLLARKLKLMGFEYLAMENLTRADFRSGLVTFQYPNFDSGFYSREPVFGDFLRKANEMGFNLVAYEMDVQSSVDADDTIGSIIERESQQSENLLEHVLNKDPDARVLIYVGYDHAKENWERLDDGRELGWMAAQLARKSGIDPLTIDQVHGSYNPQRSQVDPMFKLVEKTGQLKQSSIVQFGNDRFAVSDHYYGAIDITVFHPIQTMSKGRPNWLTMNGYRLPREIKNEEYFLDGPTLLQAFLESETKDAIPVDQVLINSQEGTSLLLLPPGDYRLVTEGPGGVLKPGNAFSISAEGD